MWFNKNNPKVVASILLLSCYIFMVNINISRRTKAIELEKERQLSVDLGNGECLLTPPGTIDASEDATKTLLASYPGSGKRFVYQIIEGLTDHAPGDDHNLSQNNYDTLHIKTSYPHNEGTWSWGERMDQMILLIRNPRWALPSYHNMRFELEFSTNWADSYTRIPNVYTVRPLVADWQTWRDANFDAEMEKWVNFIDFWMSGGAGDAHCATEMARSCYPQMVLDFDVFYQEHTTSEFLKLGTVLDASENVEVINQQARACVLDAIFDNASGTPPTELHKVRHNSNRNGKGSAPATKRFTSTQFASMLAAVNDVIARYSSPEWASDRVALDLVFILANYAHQIEFEGNFEIELGN